MELNTITMDPEAARVAYDEYATAVRAEMDAEDKAIADGYKALAEGKALIDLPTAIAAGGTTTIEGPDRWGTHRAITVPRLAAIRAGTLMAYTHGVDGRGGCEITADRPSNQLSSQNRRDRFSLPPSTFPNNNGSLWHSMRAIVPNIPPRLRPRRGLRLHTILWEAEWATDPEPPGDPALLRQLGGSLYIVLGTWDLTPLEQSVLRGRAD